MSDMVIPENVGNDMAMSQLRELFMSSVCGSTDIQKP